MGRARKLIGQTLWASLGQVAQLVTGLVSLIILVRILGAEAYGIFALGLLFTNLAEVFVGGHAADGIVQKDDLTASQKTAAYAALTLTGLACAAALVAGSDPAAAFFETPVLAEILPLMAALPLLTAAAAVPNQLLVRDLRFSALAKIAAVAALLAVGVGIALAVAGFGIWSLVGLELTRRLVMLILVHVATGWLPTTSFSLGDVWSMARFGVRRIENRGLRYLAQDALPRVFIGYGVGTEALGYYAVASRFIQQLNGVLSGPVSAVSFPAASRLRADAAMAERLIVSIIRTTTWAFWPALLGTVAVAPVLLPVMFGAGWMPAVAVLQVLALAALRSPLSGHASSVLTAYGALGDISRIQILSIAIGIVACFAGLQFGLLGIVAGLALRQWIVLPITLTFIGRCTGIVPLRQLGLLLKAGIPAVAMMVVVLCLQQVLDSAFPPALELALLVLAGVLSYGMAWLLWNAAARPRVADAVAGLVRGDREAATRSLKAIIAP